MGYLFSWLSLSKSASENALDWSEIIILVCGFILAFGAIGEYLEEHKRLPRWIGWPKIVFILMVVIGLVGEFLGDAGVYVFSRRLQSISDSELVDLRRKANDAGERAGKIELANKQLAIDLEREKQNTARFQKEADVARLALETRVRAQGPRYFLLRSLASKLARELSRFAGQRAALLVCGMYRADRETLETWGALASILGPDTVKGVKGADWKMTRGNPFWDECHLSMQGIAVMVSSESPKTTRDAAEALSRALRRALPLYNNNPAILDPARERYIISVVSVDKDDPQRLAIEDPSLIVVFMGEHPPQ
jgi:hypothetical protein